MKIDENNGDEMRDSYDETTLKNGVKDKYSRRFKTGNNLAKLAPDIRKAYPTDEDLDRVLRSLLERTSVNTTS